MGNIKGLAAFQQPGSNRGSSFAKDIGKHIVQLDVGDSQAVLAHPKYVKAIRGKKTDQKDAKWIADIFKHDLVSGSFVPPADV
mgnify:CR=1 FL=1